MKNRIVVALGGNALGKSAAEQLELVKHTSKAIVDLVEEGNDVVVAHGNGPQVGMINLAIETASKTVSSINEMPFPECGAMSQGYIGYHLQNAIRTELLNRGIVKNVETIITQTIVDENDDAFKNPTKPIGSFYSKEEAEEIEKEKGYVIKEDSGRGYRRVVASPKPVDIVEKNVIKTLVENGDVVICVGGGGIPVIEKGNELIGVAAVIDKDLGSEKMAELVNADYLVILTAVDKVAINFGKPDQEELSELSTEVAEKYAEEGQFGAGSMLPKVMAAVQFVKSGDGRRSLITSLEKVKAALDGETGTVIK